MAKINIAGHELSSGKTIKDHIHVDGTEIHIPHIIICGEKPGKTVLVTAGSHRGCGHSWRRTFKCHDCAGNNDRC